MQEHRVTKNDIITKIESDLKDKKYSNFITEIDGISTEPIYTKEEIGNIPMQSISDQNIWQIAQAYFINDINENNKELLNDLNQGVNALFLNFSKHDLWTQSDFINLFKGVQLQYISIHIRGLGANSAKQFQHFLLIDSTSNTFEITSDIFINEQVKSYAIKITDTQSIGKALSIIDKNLVEVSSIYFEIVLGFNYFYEIAKIRALKLLWEKMMEFYKKEMPIYTIAISSKKSNSEAEVNKNMLRNTAEAMSAIIGGVSVLYIAPFDENYKEENEFSKRISKNIQLILQEESAFGIVHDPAKGSYYIEKLTSAIAEKAWVIFKGNN